MGRPSEAYRELMTVHKREYNPQTVAQKQDDDIKTRRTRLSWHIFWLTTGLAVGVAVTFVTAGIWMHIAILGTGVPAYAQEVTDFIKAL